MSTPTVTKTIKGPGQTVIAGATARMRMVAATSGQGWAYYPATNDIGGVRAGSYNSTTGVFTWATVVPCSLLADTSCRYEVIVTLPGVGDLNPEYINVPNGAGPYEVRDILDDDPTSLPGVRAASSVTYDNDTSGLDATNVQDAIDELAQSATTYQAMIEADSPEAFWPLEEPAFPIYDTVGGREIGQDGSVGLNDARGADGVSPAVLTYDNSWIGCIDAWQPTGAFSVEAWVKVVTADSATLLAETAATNGWRLLADTGDGFTFTVHSNSLQTITDGDAIAAGWHHVAATRASTGAMKLYVDGVEAASGAGAAGSVVYTLADPPSIGGPDLEAAIQRVAFYEVVLTAAQVAAHYERGLVPELTPGLWGSIDGIVDDEAAARATADGLRMLKSANLSDVASAATSRTNLGLGTVATLASDTDGTLAANSDVKVATQKAGKTYADLKLAKASNLSDLASAATARTNLGLGTIATFASSAYAAVANNLSDLASAATARTNLGLGTAATFASSAFLQAANNLSDLANAATARTNLGLGSAATQASTVFAQVANNLSDLANAATARGNLGLGTIATQAANNVTITGGSITAITDLAIADGGTGASTAANAFAALKQDASTSATGVSELATDAETETGTDTARVPPVSSVAATYPKKSMLTTAGDVPYATGAGAWSRLAPGTAYQVLRMNAGATAPEWVTGARELIAETILGAPAASIDFSSIPATFRHLVMEFAIRTDRVSTTDDLLISFNADTTSANYDHQRLGATASTAAAAEVLGSGGTSSTRIVALLTGASSPTSHAAIGYIMIPQYAQTAWFKEAISSGMAWRARTTGLIAMRHAICGWASTAAVNQITLVPLVGPNFDTGSRVSLYGIG